MTRFAEKYSVESSRMAGWDYSTPGIYFITINCVHHNKFFGKSVQDQIVLSEMGHVANEELLKTFEIRDNIKLHDYVIMPNHVHILMELIDNISLTCRDVSQNVSTNNKYFSLISPRASSISVIIREYKSAVTRIINPRKVFFAWQPRFHDEIIRSREEYLVKQKYIKENPKNWQRDPYHL